MGPGEHHLPYSRVTLCTRRPELLLDGQTLSKCLLFLLPLLEVIAITALRTPNPAGGRLFKGFLLNCLR